MQSSQGISYLFLCGNKTQDECFQKKLFGRSKRYWEIVQSIKAGSTLFLYNIKSNNLIGPFKAGTNGTWMQDPTAWSMVRSLAFPAQIKVKWQELKILEDASSLFNFLLEQPCKLSSTQTSAILMALENAPLFCQTKEKAVSIPISEKLFSKFLDSKGVSYIRFSQTPEDYSKTLKSLKAKRPDFIVLSRNPILIEIKPYQGNKEFEVGTDEIEKLRQLELLFHLETIIIFPTNSQGVEWKSVSPLWIWAHGEKKWRGRKSVLSLKTSELAARAPCLCVCPTSRFYLL